MYSRRPSCTERRRSRGFSLIELMVGIVIGLLASLAVTQVLVSSEGQKRATTSGSDAQVNGVLALTTLQRGIQSAGYGLTATPTLIGCTITAKFDNNDIAAGSGSPLFPTSLVPVTIQPGASGAPDTIRVFSSGKPSYSVPVRMNSPGYDPAVTAYKESFPVPTTRNVLAGDLMLVASENKVAQVQPDGTTANVFTTPCSVFQATSTPGAGVLAVPREDSVSSRWNAAGFPSNAYPGGSYIINLGANPQETIYSISNNALYSRSLNVSSTSVPSYPAAVELYPNIVNMRALYGKDTDGNGAVDRWDDVTPTTNDGWRQVIAIRIALVSRNTQFEKEAVTGANPKWDLGTGATVSAASLTCDANNVCDLKVTHVDDWQRYRYRVFDTIVPLRNMIWNAS